MMAGAGGVIGDSVVGGEGNQGGVGRGGRILVVFKNESENSTEELMQCVLKLKRGDGRAVFKGHDDASHQEHIDK